MRPTNMSAAPSQAGVAGSKSVRPTRVRHTVLWLTVMAYMVTYMDRGVISAAAPYIQKEFGFSLMTMGFILSAFRWGYTIFQIPGGWLGDRIGPRRALTLIVTLWSFFTSATAFCWSAPSFLVTRFLFGVGEAGAFPIATRSLSRWMLRSERGYAQGVTHAGSRLGAAFTPPIVVWLIAAYGWRAPFLAFGCLGVIWATVWYIYYRDTPGEHRSVNTAELELIHASTGQPSSHSKSSPPWRAILASRTMWLICLMYFCYSYCLATYLEWFPTYLLNHRGYNLKEMGFYASLPLFAGTAGDLAGGWLSDLWLKRSGNLVFARRFVGVGGFLLAGAAIIPATLTPNPLTNVLLTCVAVFGLELTVGVSWALPLDIGSEYAGSVSALMNSFGNIGGSISPLVLAYLVGKLGWDEPFFVASALCFIAAILYSRIDASRRILRESV
jgi:MFS transporter, ACS family, glucarate transporter